MISGIGRASNGKRQYVLDRGIQTMSDTGQMRVLEKERTGRVKKHLSKPCLE